MLAQEERKKAFKSKTDKKPGPLLTGQACSVTDTEDIRKNDRQSATMNAEIKRHNKSRTKDIKNGVSILSNKLDTYDCAFMTSYNSNLSDEVNHQNFTRFQYQAIDKGFLVFLIKADSKVASLVATEIQDCVLCLIDFKGFETLEENTIIWAKEYNQNFVLYLPREGRTVEITIIANETSKKEISSYYKIKTCKHFIEKLLKRKSFKFENALIVEIAQPVNNMGRWFINSLIKEK